MLTLSSSGRPDSGICKFLDPQADYSAEFGHAEVMSKTDAEAHIEGPLSDALAQLDSLIQNTFMVELPPDLRWDALLLTFTIAIMLFFARSGRGSRGADGHERRVGFWQFLFRKKSTLTFPPESISGYGRWNSYCGRCGWFLYWQRLVLVRRPLSLAY